MLLTCCSPISQKPLDRFCYFKLYSIKVGPEVGPYNFPLKIYNALTYEYLIDKYDKVW